MAGGGSEAAAEARNLRLCEAVVDDDLDRVRAALTDGAEVNARVRIERLYQQGRLAYPGQAALGWARSVPMVELLLDAGAEIDGRDEGGETALSRAVLNSRGQDLGIIETLLRRGANPDVLAAVRGGGVRLMRPLLQAGAKITRSLVNHWRHDPEVLALLEEWPIRSAAASEPDRQLMLAARAGALETVTTLLGEGADARVRDADAVSALEHAWRKGHAGVALVLERAAAAGQVQAALFVAALDDSAGGVRKAAVGADLEAHNQAGATALMLAARYRRHSSVRALVAAGAKLDQRALVAAIEAGDLDGMRLLFELGGSLAAAPEALLRAACAQPDSDLLRHLLVSRIDVTGCRDVVTANDESDRLLRNARAGHWPPAGPTAAAWQDCPLCRDLPAALSFSVGSNGDQTGDPLPAVTEQFETFGLSWSGLWKCPHCGTYYDHESDHDNGPAGNWDSQYLARVERTRALELLRGWLPGPRLEREIAALTKVLAFDQALAAPGRKVHVSGTRERDGTRDLTIYGLSGAGARPLATRWVLDPEHAAQTADLTARGVTRAETDAPSDFIWVLSADGLEVYDHKHLVLTAANDRVTQEDGRTIARADLARVIAFASDDYVHRGIKAVLSSGEEVDLVTDASLAAMSGIGYSRNDLLFDTGWCSKLGVALARWAGAEFDDQI
ncbi:MAG: hypothetical protein IT370_24385 [Deltaproteobacteria bacterium]|nr:hypothetical protein [Deltaproteobacteria bacterium]